MEVAEARIMLTSPEDVQTTVDSSNQVVNQYSQSMQQQYVAPAQDQVQAGLNTFLATTSAISSSANSSSQPPTPVDSYIAAFGLNSYDAGAISQPAMSNALVSSGQSVSAATGSTGSSSGSSSGSLFDQGTNLQGYGQNIVQSAFGSSGSSGSSGSGDSTGSSNSSSDNSGSSGSGDNSSGSGSSESSGGTGGSSGSGSNSTSGGEGSSGNSGGNSSGSNGSSGDGSNSSSGSGSSGSGGSSGNNNGGSNGGTVAVPPSWNPFVLPEGISFEDVHLSAESSIGNLLALQPTGTDSFTQTTITETANTRLVVTLTQDYIDANSWIVTQSWSKEFTVTQSTGNVPTNIDWDAPASSWGSASGSSSGSTSASSTSTTLGPWSTTTRSRLTTFSITVSSGFGVPSPPAFLTRSSSSASSSATSSSSSGSALAPSSAASTVVVVGPVATIAFSDADKLIVSQGDSTDNSDATTGKVDKSNYAGKATFNAKKNFVLTEFDIVRPDLTLGHTTQLGFGNSMDRSMKFKAGYDLFEADGTVLDATDSPTTATSHPYGSTYASRGTLPATDPATILDGTAAPIATGGDGTRFSAYGSITQNAFESEGCTVSAEATTDIGEEIEESDIHGEVDITVGGNGSITVKDGLTYDDQESDPVTGDIDYLSLGVDENDTAGVSANFEMDISLDDADLPDSTPTDSSGGSSSGSSGGSSGSSLIGSGGPGGGSGSSTPSQGAPVIKLNNTFSIGGGETTFLQFNTKKTTITPGSGTNPNATPITETMTGEISLRMGGGISGSVKMGISGWTPTLTINASGNVSATYSNVSFDHFKYGFDTMPPEGYNMVICDKEKYFKGSDVTTATLTFSVGLTLGGSSPVAPTATVTVNLERHVLDITGCSSHVRIERIGDPTDFYENFSKGESGYVGSVITTGNGTSGLTTTVKENPSYSWASSTSSGTPPTPDEGPARTLTAVLDAVQLGLDLAGMVPVAGEVCDLTNAIISAGRGNTGDAMLSLAATFPFGGQAATAGKLGNKAAKALAKNADKLDEVMDGGKAIVKKLEDAKPPCSNGLCFAPGTLVLTEQGERPIETVAKFDRVWAHDVVTGEWRLCSVLQTFVRDYEGDGVFVTVEGETIESTFHHPYWVVAGEALADRPQCDHHEVVQDTGATPGRWVDAGDLQIGDILLARDGRYVPITALNLQPVAHPVHNFTVSQLHNYAITHLGLLVHNNCGDELRKGLPNNARSTKSFDEIAKRLNDNCGIDPNLASERLHKLKEITGRGGADNVIFDMSGNVYDSVTRELIGTLTRG